MLNISMPYTKKLVGIVKEKLSLEKRGDIRKYLRECVDNLLKPGFAGDQPHQKGADANHRHLHNGIHPASCRVGRLA